MEVFRALSLGPEAPSAAREAACVLVGQVGQDLVDAAAMVVSELVTNSVRHSGMRPGAPILVRLVATDHSVRVEVTDDGRGFRPRVSRPSIDAEGGWGLYLVERLAHQWGVLQDGRVVWAELQASQAA
jgi:anti-sigma regulatory factor (Ser/Thr protein kinase)